MSLDSQPLVFIIIFLKTAFNVRAMLVQSYFLLPVLHHLCACKYYHLTCLSILEGDIIGIKNHGNDKYFSFLYGGNWVDHLMEK